MAGGDPGAVEYQGQRLDTYYTDPDCTKVYDGGERPDEITFYIPAGEISSP